MIRRIYPLTALLVISFFVPELTFSQLPIVTEAETAPPPDGRSKTAQQAPFTPPALRDPDEQWIETTLASMTLEEKVGQMIMPQVSSISGGQSAISSYSVGGFVFLRTDDEDVLSITNALQQSSDVPLLFSIDCEAGTGARVPQAIQFPHAMGLAATGSTEYARMQGIVTARECRVLGVQVAFGPVLDVNTEPSNPIIGIRSLGDDPRHVETMARAFVEGAHSAGLLTTFKHYPAHGGSSEDSHGTLPEIPISCNQLEQVHLRPYETLIGEGLADLVMTAHVWVPCLDPGETAWPATLSSEANTRVLREELGFEGVLITDAFNMSGLQIAVSTREGAAIAVQSGVDVILMPSPISDAHGGIMDAIDDGEITTARIDESVRRILRLKSRVGLPEAAVVPTQYADYTIAHPDHLAASDDVANACVATSFTQPDLFPFANDTRVLCVRLNSSSGVFFVYSTSYFADELDSLLSNVTVVSTSSFSNVEIVGMAESGDYDVVVAACNYWKPQLGSNWTSLLEDLSSTDVPLVYASFGSPYHVMAIPEITNTLCTFTPHYEAQRAAARVLAGDAEAAGTWPVSLYGDAWKVR